MATIRINAGGGSGSGSNGIGSPYRQSSPLMQAFNDTLTKPGAQSANNYRALNKQNGNFGPDVGGKGSTEVKSPNRAAILASRRADQVAHIQAIHQTHAAGQAIRNQSRIEGIRATSNARISSLSQTNDARSSVREYNDSIRHGRMPILAAGNMARSALKSGDMKEFKRMDAHLNTIATDTRKQLALEKSKATVNSSEVKKHEAVLREIGRQQSSMGGMRTLAGASGGRGGRGGRGNFRNRASKGLSMVGLGALDFALDADPVTMALGAGVTAASSEFIAAKGFGMLSSAESPYRNAKMAAIAEGIKNGTGGFYKGAYGSKNITANNLARYGLSPNQVLPMESAYGSSLHGGSGGSRLTNLVGLMGTTRGFGGISANERSSFLGTLRQTQQIGSLKAGGGAFTDASRMAGILQMAVTKGANNAEVFKRMNHALQAGLAPGVNGVSAGEVFRIARGGIAGGTTSGINGTSTLSAISALAATSNTVGSNAVRTQATAEYINRFGNVKSINGIKKALGSGVYKRIMSTTVGRKELLSAASSLKSGQETVGLAMIARAAGGTQFMAHVGNYFSDKIGMSGGLRYMTEANIGYGSSDNANINHVINQHRQKTLMTTAAKPTSSMKLRMLHSMHSLMAMGIPSNIAAGMTGNAVMESGLDPSKSQIGGGGGQGLYQWTSAIRKANFKRHEGVSVKNATFAQQENYAVWSLKHHYPALYKKMLHATPAEAARLFSQQWEEPASATAHNSARESFAVSASGLVAGTTNLHGLHHLAGNPTLGGLSSKYQNHLIQGAILANNAAQNSQQKASRTVSKMVTPKLINDAGIAFGKLNNVMGATITDMQKFSDALVSMIHHFKKLEKTQGFLGAVGSTVKSDAEWDGRHIAKTIEHW